MGKTTTVEIPPGSGNKYRYVYDTRTGETVYLGPVGDVPELSEIDFMRYLLDEIEHARRTGEGDMFDIGEAKGLYDQKLSIETVIEEGGRQDELWYATLALTEMPFKDGKREILRVEGFQFIDSFERDMKRAGHDMGKYNQTTRGYMVQEYLNHFSKLSTGMMRDHEDADAAPVRAILRYKGKPVPKNKIAQLTRESTFSERMKRRYEGKERISSTNLQLYLVQKDSS